MKRHTQQLYPEIPQVEPSAPVEPSDESQIYRLRKLDDSEKFLQNEIKERDRLSKKFKLYNTAVKISDYALITSSVILNSGAIVAVSTGVGAPLSIPLTSVGLGLSLAIPFIHKTIKKLNTKISKHNEIKVLTESKLGSISSVISQAIQDAHISQQEFERILKEIEHYRDMKEDIRRKTKKRVSTITTEQKLAIFNQGKKQGKEDFLKQIANTSDIQTATVT